MFAHMPQEMVDEMKRARAQAKAKAKAEPKAKAKAKAVATACPRILGDFMPVDRASE